MAYWVVDGTADSAAVATARAAVGAALGTAAVRAAVGVAMGGAAGAALRTGPPAGLPDNSMDRFSPSSFNKRFHSFSSFTESPLVLFLLFCSFMQRTPNHLNPTMGK